MPSIEPSELPKVSPAKADSRRLRVLWLVKGLGRGGAEMLLYQAARLHDRDAFECQVGYLLGSRGWLADDLRAEGVPVHLFESERHGDLRWALKLRRFLTKHPVDVVHVHSPLVAAVARLVVRSMPHDVRPQTISTEHLPWSGHRLPTRLLNGLTFGLDAAHLAVSDAVLESIPERKRHSVQVLVHGVPVDQIRSAVRWRDQMRAELGIEDDEVLICTVANLTPQKGYPDLLAAARAVLDAGHRVRFAIAGRGTLDSDIREMRDRLGLGDRLIMLGAIDDVPRFIAGGDLFLLASHWEGLPLVLMEAMAIGLPIVATRVGGIPELVRDGLDGMLVPHARPDLLAEAIGEMVRDPGRRNAMSHAASEGAYRFDNRPAVRAIEALYREVAGVDAPDGEKARK
jgi:glycosyltransferase involved in cell wall biosynthesis